MPTSLLASGGGLPSLADLPALVMGFLNPAHPEHLPMLLVYAGGALTISFVCSLLEATLLSVRVTELMRRSEDGGRGVELLLRYKQERIEDGIGAILTLNTIAHTIGASLAGAQAARVFSSESLTEDAAVAGFSAILTVAVLVATEIVPKTLGTNDASALAPFVGYAVHGLAMLTKPVLVVTGFLTRLLSRREPEGISRGELQALVNMAQQHGAIAQDESRVLSNLLGFEGLRVADVMTPRTVLRMIRSDATVGACIDDEALAEHSRIPVYETSRDHVKGYVHQRELLRAVAAGGSREQPLSGAARVPGQPRPPGDRPGRVRGDLWSGHPRGRGRDAARRRDRRRGGPGRRSARARGPDPPQAHRTAPPSLQRGARSGRPTASHRFVTPPVLPSVPAFVPP